MSRRPIHGTRCTRANRRSETRRAAQPGRTHGGSAAFQSDSASWPSACQTASATRRWPSAFRCSRSSAHSRSSPSASEPYRSTTSAPCSSASASMKENSRSIRGRYRSSTGPRRPGLRISTSCLQLGASVSTASRSRAHTASTSHPGRSTSFRPPTSVTRSARIAAAGPAWSSAICPMSFPRTARFAYRNPGVRAARRAASRSAQPRYEPSGRASDMPSVKESPTATKLV